MKTRPRKIADNTINFEAYRCALESMSERWCQMKDAESFVKFKASHRRINQANSELANAVSLNDREIPVLLDWLNKVRNGVSPRTTADAARRRTVLARELIVRTKSDFGLSLIEQNRKIYESMSANPESQWSLLRTLILQLAPQYGNESGGPDISNPLNDIYAQKYSPYYLSGFSESDERIRNNCNGICDFQSFDLPAGHGVTLDSVKGKYITWLEKATIFVNRELSEVQQPDPLQTLSTANMESEPWMITPLDALKNIADFIKQNPPQTNQRDFKKIYEDTLKKVQNIHDVTTLAIATGAMGSEDGNKTPIEDIFETAQLQYGIVVLQSRLEMIVRLSLLEYINSSPKEDQILLAQILASDRFFETMSKMNGTSSYRSLLQDIESGAAYTIKNLSSFMDIFGVNINRSLQRLYNEEVRAGQSSTVGKANRHLRASLCFVALGAENVDKFINVKLCTGLKMLPVEPGGPESITLSDSTFKQDLAKRACVYREFFRQSDIYQKWGIKN